MGLTATKQHVGKQGQVLKRGLIKTARYKLCGATPHKITTATPLQAAWLAKTLEMWLNDQYGDCVSAEECAALACYSSGLGLPEVHITDTVLQAFCEKNDLLNGANLQPVIQLMQQQGLTLNGVTYTDGPGTSVDYSNEAILQNAISLGPVKIGIDADALPSGAGNMDGWIDADGTPGQYTNEDHCVGLYAYGPAAWIVQQLQATYNVTITLPSTIAPTDIVYVLYTWGTMGIVTHAWIMSTCGEAWVRTPTTLANGVPLVGPTPPIPPIPPTPPTPPGPSPFTIQVPQQPVIIFGIPLGHVPAFTVQGQMGKPGAVHLTLPSWLLPLLQIACAGGPALPPPWNYLLGLLCTFVPPVTPPAKNPCCK